MNPFKVIIYVIAAIPLLTGAIDFIVSVPSQQTFGMVLPVSGLADPMLNSSFRFFAAIWFGVGILLIMFVRNLAYYRNALAVLLGIIFLAGLGRILSVYQCGLPKNQAGAGLVIFAITIEVLLMPILLGWLLRLDLCEENSSNG